MDSSKSPFDDPDLSGKSESATGDPSSATAIFGTIQGKPAPEQEDDILKSLLKGAGSSPAIPSETPLSAVTPPATPQPSAQTSSPGGFTDIFQSLQSSAGVTPSPEPPRAPASPLGSSSGRPTDLSSVFTQVVVEKTTFSPPPVPSPPKGGEFTQLLQTMSAAAQKPETQTAPPATASPSAPASAPGAVTQIFSSGSSSASSNPGFDPQATASIPIYSPPASAAPQPGKPEEAKPGDFTRMFQSLTPPNESAPPPATPGFPPPQQSGPGAFTQMFAPKPLESTPAEDPLKSLRPEPAPAPQSSTFSFQTPSPRPPEPAPIAQGGFTQLLQALNKEETAAKLPEPFMPPPPSAPAVSGAGMGGFTQLLQTLSAEPSAAQPAPPPASAPVLPPASPPVSGGAGEFTRVISGSQLREFQGQNVGGGPPVLPPQQPAAARPAMPPMQFPQAPAFPAAPPMPHIPAAAPQAAAPPAALPHFQAPAFQFPPAPAPPAPPPPAPSKLQQYLPLILVLNIFVLLVIVVILIFVLRHH